MKYFPHHKESAHECAAVAKTKPKNLAEQWRFDVLGGLKVCKPSLISYAGGVDVDAP